MLTHSSDTIENIERLRTVVEEVPCDEVLGVVVYDLPGRDCAAKASNGELKVGEIERYKTEFIDRESTTSLPSFPRFPEIRVSLNLSRSTKPPPPFSPPLTTTFLFQKQASHPEIKPKTDTYINSYCRDHKVQAQHGLRPRH